MSIEKIKLSMLYPKIEEPKSQIAEAQKKKVEKKKQLIPDSDSEDDEPIPWTMEALGGDFSTDNIISSLTDESQFTYNTKKSKKEFRNMFRIICQTMEDVYLEKN